MARILVDVGDRDVAEAATLIEDTLSEAGILAEVRP